MAIYMLMLLSETYKRRIGELAGLGLLKEADHRDIIVDRIGLPPNIALWAHNLSDKYSIWIANTLKQEIIKFLVRDDANETVRAEVERKFKGANTPAPIKKTAEKAKQSFEGQYRYILDWLRGRHQLAPETDVIDFKNLTLEDANERSRVWHENLARLEAGKIKDEDGEVVITFQDGFYWINLGKARCEKEAKAMGHCGTGRGTLYSLRKDGYPYITVDLSPNGTVFQMKGRANEKPNSKYHKYILAFITDPKIDVEKFQSTYRPETDFSISDLSDVDLEELYKAKPSLFEANILSIRPQLVITWSEKYPSILDTIFNKNNRAYNAGLTNRFIEELQDGSKYEKFLEKYPTFFSLILNKYPNVIIEKIMYSVNLKKILELIKDHKELFNGNDGVYKLLASKIRDFDDYRLVSYKLNGFFDMATVLKTTNIESKFNLEQVSRVVRENPELLEEPKVLDVNEIILRNLNPTGIQKIYSAEKVMEFIKNTSGVSDIINMSDLFDALIKRFKETEGFRIFIKELIETYPDKLNVNDVTYLLALASTNANVENIKNIFEERLMNDSKISTTRYINTYDSVNVEFTENEVALYYKNIGDANVLFDPDLEKIVRRAYDGSLRFKYDFNMDKYINLIDEENHIMIGEVVKAFSRYERKIGAQIKKKFNSIEDIIEELSAVRQAVSDSANDSLNYEDTKLIKKEILNSFLKSDILKAEPYQASDGKIGIVILLPKKEFYRYVDNYLDKIISKHGYNYDFLVEDVLEVGLNQDGESLIFPVNVEAKLNVDYFNRILHNKLIEVFTYFSGLSQ